MWDLLNKPGRFSISRQLMREEQKENILKVFSNMVVVRAEYMFVRDEIEYEAMSPLFRTVKSGEILPTYKIIVNEIHDGDGEIIDIIIEAKEIKGS